MSQKVYYKMTVYTGLRKNAGTKSNVCFVLSGKNGDTGVRVLDDGKGKHFGRGTLHNFVMSVDENLGELNMIRVWHDNSGKGDNASWFLDKIVVEDLKEKIRYYFLNSRWMSVEEDDGQVSRDLLVAGVEEVNGFQHLFYSSARKNLTDDHLWISVAARPTKSNFTRLQRLTCCLTVLFTTMIANAMWYRTDESVDREGVVRIGPITLSTSTIYTSVMSSLTVAPINVIIVNIFRKSRFKKSEVASFDSEKVADDQHKEKTKKSKAKKAKKEKKEDKEKIIQESPREKIKEKSKKKKKKEEDAFCTIVLEDLDEGTKKAYKDEMPVPEKPKKKWWKQKYPLPYKTIYIGWVLAILTSLASSLFVIFYSLDWGKVRSEEWLSALLLSVVQSVMLIEPVKVILLAVLLSCIFKKSSDEEDEELEELEKVHQNTKPESDEELVVKELITLDKVRNLALTKPPEAHILEQARKKREDEKKKWAIIKEVVGYFLFLILIGFIAGGSRSENMFLMNRNIHLQLDTTGVTDGFAFWEWLDQQAIPNLFYMQKYNLDPTSRRERLYMSDASLYRVGSVRLRQLRIRPASCEPPEAAQKFIIECNAPYEMMSEEDRDFSIGWHYLDDNYTQPEPLNRTQQAYRFMGTLELKGLPYMGIMATYGGGGYVADLGTSPYKARKVTKELLANDWIDYYTRAVFLEFTVYNPNTNLFSYVLYLLEFPPSGGILPWPRIMSFQVYTNVGGLGVAVFAGQILFALIIGYFLLKEAMKIYKERKAYFKKAWNIYEVVMLLTCVVGIAMFAMRTVFGKILMKSLREDPEAFTNYFQFAVYDELFMYVCGIIIFLANMKFLRLLRFNEHVCHLVATLIYARQELLSFFVCIGVIFMAFSSCGYMLFNITLKDFSNLVTASESLFATILGRFSFYAMANANRVLGPIFFVSYVMTMYFFLANIFIGILVSAYDTAKSNPNDMYEPVGVFDFLKSEVKKKTGMVPRAPSADDGYVDVIDSLDAQISALDAMVTTELKRQYKMEYDSSTPAGATPMKTEVPWQTKGKLMMFNLHK